MRINWQRFIMMLLVLVAIQYATILVLGNLGVGGTVIMIVVCILSAFAMTILNVPKPYRKAALRSPDFHKEFVITAIILIIFNLIF